MIYASKIGLIHFYCNLHKKQVELFLALNIIPQMLLIKAVDYWILI